LTLVELASVYSRAGLEEPLPLVMYSVRSVGAEVVEVDFSEVLKGSIVKAHPEAEDARPNSYNGMQVGWMQGVRHARLRHRGEGRSDR
jgi:hypothetical protein